MFTGAPGAALSGDKFAKAHGGIGGCRFVAGQQSKINTPSRSKRSEGGNPKLVGIPPDGTMIVHTSRREGGERKI